MYIVFTNHKEEALLGRHLDFPCAEIITKCKESIDNFILSCYNNKEDYLLVEVTNDELKYLDGNKYLYDMLKED